MDKCPFCGAKQIGHAYNRTIFKYGCDTWAPSKDPADRSRKCYEAELATLKVLVRKMGKELRCYCTSATATANGEPVPVTVEKCGVCKLLSRPQVKKIMEEGHKIQQKQQCDTPCPHSTFETLHCCLSKGHAGPHNWVSSLQVKIMEEKP